MHLRPTYKRTTNVLYDMIWYMISCNPLSVDAVCHDVTDRQTDSGPTEAGGGVGSPFLVRVSAAGDERQLNVDEDKDEVDQSQRSICQLSDVGRDCQLTLRLPGIMEHTLTHWLALCLSVWNDDCMGCMGARHNDWDCVECDNWQTGGQDQQVPCTKCVINATLLGWLAWQLRELLCASCHVWNEHWRLIA